MNENELRSALDKALAALWKIRMEAELLAHIDGQADG